MMTQMEKRKKKLELKFLRGILGAIEADIDLEHDFSELLEGAPIKGHRTVPRQTNVPPETNPPCQTNVASTEPETEQEGDDEDWCPKELIYNPLEWKIMPVPEIGKKVYMVVPTTKGLIVVVDEFKGTEMEWLLLAQGRLFIYKSEAERYKQKCEAVIGAIAAQLND